MPPTGQNIKIPHININVPTCIIYLRNMHVKSCNHIITYIITFNIIISYDNHLTLSKRTHNGHKPNAHKLGRYNYPLLTRISSSKFI